MSPVEPPPPSNAPTLDIHKPLSLIRSPTDFIQSTQTVPLTDTTKTSKNVTVTTYPDCKVITRRIYDLSGASRGSIPTRKRLDIPVPLINNVTEYEAVSEQTCPNPRSGRGNRGDAQMRAMRPTLQRVTAASGSNSGFSE